MKRSVIFLLLSCLFMTAASAISSPDEDFFTGPDDLSVSDTVSQPVFSTHDLTDAIYAALIQANPDFNDGQISNVEIMPLYTPDTGQTTIPTSSLRAVLVNLIGPYSPVVVQYQYTSGTNTQYLREILPDYVWMFSCAIFALVLYCTFRIGGCLLWRR